MYHRGIGFGYVCWSAATRLVVGDVLFACFGRSILGELFSKVASFGNQSTTSNNSRSQIW